MRNRGRRAPPGRTQHRWLVLPAPSVSRIRWTRRCHESVQPSKERRKVAGMHPNIFADIVVHSEDEQPSVVVEVKNREDLSGGDAAGFRRNLVAHGLATRAP